MQATHASQQGAPVAESVLGASQTDQGRERARVVLACRTCRARKIKCDGLQPICSTCVRRKNLDCVFDEVPRRRGPDRQPRSRPHQSNNSTGASSSSKSRSRKRPAETNAVDAGGASPPATSSTSPQQQTAKTTAAWLNDRQVPHLPHLVLDGVPHHSNMGDPASVHSSLPSASSSSFSPLHPTPIAMMRPNPLHSPSRRSPDGHPPHPLAHPLASSSPSLSVIINPLDIPPHHPRHPSYPESADDDRWTHPTANNSIFPPSTNQVVHEQYHPTFFDHSTLESTAAGHDPLPWAPPQARSSFSHSGEDPTYDGPRAMTTYLDATTYQQQNYKPALVDPLSNHEGRRNSQQQEEEHALKYSSALVSEPSLEFKRKSWWDSLVTSYGPDRATSTKHILTDISHLFKTGNYLISFINVPIFFSSLYDPFRRDLMHPALVLSVLALSTLWQSSDIALGHEGRMQALWLRDEAQAALEASLNAMSLSPELAQAALLLSLFESSPHPHLSVARSHSAVSFLDSLICALGLLQMDADSPRTTHFERKVVPSIEAPVHSHSPTGRNQCSCRALQNGNMNPASRAITPFWSNMPGWDPNWSITECKREENRRLVWTALQIGSAHVSNADTIGQRPPTLTIVKPWKFNVLFPGEMLFESGSVSPLRDGAAHEAAKHTVWSLQARSQLLNASCVAVRWDDEMNEMQKADFAVKAWIETEAIEKALNAHSCDIEKSTLFYAREQLFNTQMLVSSHYSRYVPHPAIGDARFNRDRAVKWLMHQRVILTTVKQDAQIVSDLPTSPLARRPFYIFWFMSQVARYLSLWKRDHSLSLALELSKAVLPAIEYLTALWPCEYQRQHFAILRDHLVKACLMQGIPPPPRPNPSLPIVR